MSKEEILAVYESMDDNNISTERLLQIVADMCDCEIDEVIDALIEN